MPEASNDFGLVARMLSDGFNRIDHRLDELNRRLDSKADNTRVAELEGKVAAFEIKIDERLQPLEDAAVGRAVISNLQRRTTNALVAIAASSVGALLYLLVSGGIR